MNRLHLFLFLFILFSGKAEAQNDSLSLLHSPRKATLLSVALPGAGQVYNKKYWKVPVIYAGFAALGYFVVTNNKDYRLYKNSYKLRLDGDVATVDQYVGIYSDDDLATLKNFYRRNRDLSVIGISLLYVLNIIDATVDAHLFHFNISDELSMAIRPGFASQNFNGPALSLNIYFK